MQVPRETVSWQKPLKSSCCRFCSGEAQASLVPLLLCCSFLKQVLNACESHLTRYSESAQSQCDPKSNARLYRGQPRRTEKSRRQSCRRSPKPRVSPQIPGRCGSSRGIVERRPRALRASRRCFRRVAAAEGG